jgi:DNA sulfur modification protein DndC
MEHISKGGTMQVLASANFARAILDELSDAYLSDDRPWVVGYSGGKDSTTALQFVYYMLLSLPPEKRSKKVYVLASDTRVEAPSIVVRINNELALLRKAVERDKLPVEAAMVYPELNDSFWVNLIGRGYPSPNRWFRWCTDRLKIRPVSKFIVDRVSEFGSVVVVLGSRSAESNTRAQTMAAYHIDGQRFRPHSDLPKAWVYTPIEHLSNDDIWTYLLQVRSPWDGDNRGLVALYKRASGGECPLVIDTSTPSCGQSRFGCWVCTVVEKDKSMEALVDDGEEKYEPLLELRDYLKWARDQESLRMDKRRNGQDGLGPFTHGTRRDLLRMVLEAQKKSEITLIEGDELAAIGEIWAQEGQPVDIVERIWRHVYEEEPMPDEKENQALSQEDVLLERVCRENGISFEMMRRLRDLEEEYGALKRRHGLPEQMRDTVKKHTESTS